MARTLTLEDVMGDQIDAKAFEAPVEPAKKEHYFRTKTGSYLAHVHKTFIQVVDGGPKEGRKQISLLLKLYDDTKKFQGSCFARASWMLYSKADGSPDLTFRLFQQLVTVLGAPPTAALPDVLEAIPGEWIQVWGKELYKVPVADLLPEHAAKANGRTSLVYVYPETDDEALYYLRKGIKSEFDVMNISALETAD